MLPVGLEVGFVDGTTLVDGTTEGAVEGKTLLVGIVLG